MRKRSVWAKLPHTTFVVRARNYVTRRAENWSRFNSSSATFRFELRSATLVANSESAELSTTGSVSNRSAEGNGRPTSAARCRTKGAVWRLLVQVVCSRSADNSETGLRYAKGMGQRCSAPHGCPKSLRFRERGTPRRIHGWDDVFEPTGMSSPRLALCYGRS